MTRRMRIVLLASSAVGLAFHPIGLEAAAQQVPDLPSQLRRQLPFGLPGDALPGPPRAMGAIPFGESEAPNQGAFPSTGPPRAMGESPYRNQLLQPGGTGYQPTTPPEGLMLPGVIPGLEPLPTPGPGTRPFDLFFLPGLLGRQELAEPGEEPPIDLLPEALPEAPELDLGSVEVPRGAPRVDDEPPGEPLRLEEVRLSAEQRYPPFLATLELRNVAGGGVISAKGSFDLAINIDSRNYPLGFYDRFLQDVFFEQPIQRTGAKVFAGYRLAQGQWPTYYNYLNTRDGGAFVAGFEQPLLRNRKIDDKRAKLYQAEIERRKVEPTILKDRISLLKQASKAYWNWVAAGQAYAIYQDLLELTQAQLQALQIQAQPEIGRVALVDVIAFQSVLNKRHQQLISSWLDFQNASITLSFYLRDVRSMPMLPEPERLPVAFPEVDPPPGDRLDQDIAVALRLRPEIFSLLLEYEKARIDRALAENLLKPSMNFYLYNEQNVGNMDVDLEKDFRPNILEASIFFEVPLQRRFARGRVRSTDATLRRIAAQTQFARDEIQAEVQSAFAGLQAAYRGLVYYRQSEVIARQLAEAERQRLQVQAASPLLFYVVRQQQVLDAQVLRVLAEGKYFSAVADYRAALGLDAVSPEVARNASEIPLTANGRGVRTAPAPPSPSGARSDAAPPPPPVRNGAASDPAAIPPAILPRPEPGTNGADPEPPDRP